MNKALDDMDVTKTLRRPAVTVAHARTLDGRLATSTGSSRWISASESLRFSHGSRAEHEAILLGAGTVRADDPRWWKEGPDDHRAPA
jgi:riboflavin biosynthesis pyrimidine reductase